jgi:hypothetical protein
MKNPEHKENKMTIRHPLWIILLAASLFASGCHSGAASPQELLDRYFSSAVKQDYGATYDCYYTTYKMKINRDEYIKHRKEGSVLQSYRIASLQQDGDTAQARVLLTFAPSARLARTEPVAIIVTENMIRDNGGWKIKVWQ